MPSRSLLGPAIGKPIKGLKVWIESENSIYGTSIAKQQKELLEKEGATVVGVGAHNFRAADLTRLGASREGHHARHLDQHRLRAGRQSAAAHDARAGLQASRDPAGRDGRYIETLESLGASIWRQFTVVGYPRPDQTEAYGPGAAAYLAAYKAKYQRDPIAPQGMAAYVGAKMLIEAIAAAGSVDMEKLRAAAAKMDKPEKSYATGFGVKFDAQFQNTRAFPTVVQWQSGKIVTVFPKDAAQPDVKLVNLPRK